MKERNYECRLFDKVKDNDKIQQTLTATMI